MRKLALGAVLAVTLGVSALPFNRSALADDQTVAWRVPTTSSVTINAGDTVTWNWADSLPHSVTSVTGPATFDSGILTGGSYNFTFNTAGTYTYRCNVHPDTMTGTVNVQAAQATATNTTAATNTATTVPATSTATTAPGGTSTAPAGTATTGASTTAIPGGKSITLSGAEEVPPITTSATGTFEWKLDGQTLHYRLRAQGTGLTMAHIHLGDKGANGPIVAFLFGPNQAGVSSIDQGGTITVSQLLNAHAGNMAEFIRQLQRGGLYVNVHSIEHPAGVLRGQIPGTPGAPSTGTGLVSDDDAGWDRTLVAVVGVLVIALGAAGGLTVRRWSPGGHR